MTSENTMQKSSEEKEPKRKYLEAKSSDEDMLQKLIKDQQSWYSFATDMLDRAYNIMTFLYVDQWDGDVRTRRSQTQKPTMTYNFLVPIIRAILGEARKNSPENKVVGTGENPNSDDAELRTSILRRISYECDGPMIYQTALKQAVEIGWGSAQLDICYRKGSFKKYIEMIPSVDYQSCYWDPAAQQPNRSDGDFCGNHWVMAREDFERMYPDCDNPVSVINNMYAQNEERDVVIGCNTWKKRYYNVKLCKLSDGTECTEKEAKLLIAEREKIVGEVFLRVDTLKKEIKKGLKAGVIDEPIEITEEIPELLEIVETRSEMDYDLIKYRWVNNCMLEEEKWPGKLLPIVYFEGDSTVLRGDRLALSFVQDGIDPQKLINYYGSEVALSVLNSRREQVIGTKAMFLGVEQQWKNAQSVQGFLTYNVDPLASGSGGKPEFVAPQPFHEGLLSAMQSSIVQLKQVLGRPDETQGMESNAISGVAIKSRQQAANNAVNVYIDNWERGIQQVGKVILELLPFVHAEQEMIQIREADGAMKSVAVNNPTGNFKYDEDGEPTQEIIENDLSVGDYDVEVQVAGTYDQQQLDKINTFKDFIGLLAQVDPQAPRSIIDMVPKMIGLENATEVQKRLIATAPPTMQAIIEGKDPAELPPPPPDPMVMIEEKKAEIAMADIKQKEQESMVNAQLKQEQIAVDRQKTENERLELILSAEINGINATAAIEKAKAGIISTKIRAGSEIQKAHINRSTADIKHSTEALKHHTNRMGHVAKINQQLIKQLSDDKKSAARKKFDSDE